MLRSNRLSYLGAHVAATCGPIIDPRARRIILAMLQATLVFLGAGCGGLLRYAFSAAVQSRAGVSFPWGTLAVNVTGCLAAGFLGTVLAGHWHIRRELEAGILVGVLGGYTTFSAFGRETAALVADGHPWRAAAYVLASNVVCLAAVFIGVAAARRLAGA